MEMKDNQRLPVDELKRLEFMTGVFVGEEVLYPPTGEPVYFTAHLVGDWEPCERFLKVDFYGDIPGIVKETFQAKITYSKSMSAYRMWVFLASQEDPIHMVGNFQDNKIVFVSDPTDMLWGMQKLRYTFTPVEDGYETYGERWEPDGYVPYCVVTFRRSNTMASL